MADKPFALSIKVVVRDHDGRCLLIRRSMESKANRGKWDLPGGKVDAGESFDKALLREVAEETGITISLQRVLGAAQSESPSNRVVYLIMEARLEAGQVRLSHEHIDSAWVEPAALPAMDVCDQFRPFVQAYAQGEARSPAS
jgi:8-oxo-dGTP diphosphatase